MSFTVLLDNSITASFIHSHFILPEQSNALALGESFTTLVFALLFGVRNTLFTAFIIIWLGVWDQKALGMPLTPASIITYMPQVRALIFSTFVALGYRQLANDREQAERALKMRERNRHLAIIRGLHDGAAKKITQTLIHVRTNPPVDPEVVAFLDDALKDLRRIIAETDTLYERGEDGQPMDDQVETVTWSALLAEYETVTQDRGLRIVVQPEGTEIPPLPVAASEIINNAVKYAEMGSTIVVSFAEGKNYHALQIENQIATNQPRQGSQIGLEATRMAMSKIGASFTTFADAGTFRATVLLPVNLRSTPAHNPRLQTIFNIFDAALHT